MAEHLEQDEWVGAIVEARADAADGVDVHDNSICRLGRRRLQEVTDAVFKLEKPVLLELVNGVGSRHRAMARELERLQAEAGE